MIIYSIKKKIEIEKNPFALTTIAWAKKSWVCYYGVVLCFKQKRSIGVFWICEKLIF